MAKNTINAVLGKDEKLNLGALITIAIPTDHQETKLLLCGNELSGLVNDLRYIQEQIETIKGKEKNNARKASKVSDTSK